MIGLGFLSSHADSSLFVQYTKTFITIVVLYVDDLIITGNNFADISYLVSQLGPVFVMKNLGKLHHFLGIDVYHTKYGMFLSHLKYAKDLLNRTSMLDCKSYGSPTNFKGAPQVANSIGTH